MGMLRHSCKYSIWLVAAAQTQSLDKGYNYVMAIAYVQPPLLGAMGGGSKTMAEPLTFTAPLPLTTCMNAPICHLFAIFI